MLIGITDDISFTQVHQQDFSFQDNFSLSYYIQQLSWNIYNIYALFGQLHKNYCQ
jgi:hypothetical protein